VISRSNVFLAVFLIECHEQRGVQGREGHGIVDDARRWISFDIIDVRFIERPGVDPGLGTVGIDLSYLHRWDDRTVIDETLRAVEDLVRAGKVLYPACSNFAAWQVAHALGVARLEGFAPIVAIQPMYNLVKRTAEVEILPMAQTLGIGVIPYGPTGGGLLTGKYGVGKRPASGRLLDVKMYETRYSEPSVYEVADRFTELAAELGHSPTTLAVAWVASHPTVTSVLVGGRSVEQLSASFAAADLELDADTRARISALSPSPPPATDRNEEVTANNYGSR